MAQSYTAKDITVLEGLEPVRKRPAMYIGGTDKSGYHHLLWEILDNSIDEVINHHADRVEVTLHEDGKEVTIDDNGRGIPVDLIAKYKKSALEIILTTLHAGGRVKRDGALWQQSFRRGKPAGGVKKVGPARGTGTTITFTPDEEIFGPKLAFDPQVVAERLEAKSYLHRGVKITFRDETRSPPAAQTYQHERGIAEYLGKLVAERGKDAVPTGAIGFYLERSGEIELELAMVWTEATDEQIKSYVNGVPTSSGGTHDLGLKAGVVKAVRNYMSTHDLQPKGLNVTAEDIREGMVAILSVYVASPQFQGQTKERLNNPEVQAQVDGQVRPALEQYLNENQSVAEAVVARVILAGRAREASRAASQAVSRKTAVSHRLNLPGKLADCASTNPADSELFIVEGDSAGGSAKQARDRQTQAILPLRGKVLNAEQASASKLIQNKELGDIVSALGCGFGPKMDLSRLRYHRVFLLMDADADGHHIATLLLTFFYRHMKPLIDARHVYLAQPPLYRIDIGKETFWALDDLERDRKLAEHAGKKASITRFKGLGEMSVDALKQTTLDPARRTVLRVAIQKGEELETDQVIGELLGKDAGARFRLIHDGAREVDEIDL